MTIDFAFNSNTVHVSSAFMRLLNVLSAVAPSVFMLLSRATTCVFTANPKSMKKLQVASGYWCVFPFQATSRRWR